MRKAEQALNAKIRKALSYIPNVTVTSTVTLDHEKGSRSVEIKNDPKPVPVRTSENPHVEPRIGLVRRGRRDSRRKAAGPISRPRSAPTAARDRTRRAKNQERTVNVVSTTSTEKETFGLTPKTAKVSVGIPASYYEKVWKERNPAKEGEEAKKPDQAAVDKIREEITQDVRNHGRHPAAARARCQGPDVAGDRHDLPGHQGRRDPGSAGDAAGLDVAGAELADGGDGGPGAVQPGHVAVDAPQRSGAAPAESAAVSMRVTAAEPKPQESEEAVEATAARRLRRMTGTGPSLRDELSELVKEDPDSAANILRSWIGQVS